MMQASELSVEAFALAQGDLVHKIANAIIKFFTGRDLAYEHDVNERLQRYVAR